MFIPKLNVAFLIFPVKWLFQAVALLEKKKPSSHLGKPTPLPRPNRGIVAVPHLPSR
jgi:hypothetical protein